MIRRIRRRLRAVCTSVVLVFAGLGLAACAVTSGTVTGKQHEPAREWATYETDYDTRCTGTGSSRRCTQVPDGVDAVEHATPECYRLDLKHEDATGSVCVDRETFERVQVGDHYEEG
ncbi:hypothetical protein [Micromonospora sp. NPDC047730]|uniref:hypothetical protein n=1 Tax=Micromonospora sp. NPDC047730 TaxID=3364253 RepID=UPI003720898A